MSNNTEIPKTCSICGRNAIGYHYDVISCKGCKTFFRRISLMNFEGKCDFKNQCFDLTKSNEPYLRCRACRYRKCLDVGMNQKAIQMPERNQSFGVVETMTKNTIDALVYLEEKLEKFRLSAYNPHWQEISDLELYLNNGSNLGLADKYGPTIENSVHESFAPKNSLPSSLKAVQNNTLDHCPTKKIWTLCNLLTTVEYLKTFTYFKDLSALDRLILAQHVILIGKNLHISNYSFSKKFTGCLNPDVGNDSQRERHYPVAFMLMEPLIRSQIQPVEYILLKAICCCNPAVPNLSQNAQSTLAREREQFVGILFDYCQRAGQNGPGRFAELIGIFSVMEKQQRMQKDMYMLYYAPHLTPDVKIQIKFLHDIMDS